MRSLSVNALKDMLAQESAAAYLALVTVDDGSGLVLRYVNDNRDWFHDGFIYKRMQFMVTLPADTEQRVPEVVLTLDAIDQSIVQSVRSATSRPLVSLEICRALNGKISNVLGPIEYTALAAKYDANRIEITLSFEYDYLNGAAVQHYFDNVTAPGLF